MRNLKVQLSQHDTLVSDDRGRRVSIVCDGRYIFILCGDEHGGDTDEPEAW